MSLPAALFIVFLVLKLTGVIAWSWWWVFTPLFVSIVWAVVGIVLDVQQQLKNERIARSARSRLLTEMRRNSQRSR